MSFPHPRMSSAFSLSEDTTILKSTHKHIYRYTSLFLFKQGISYYIHCLALCFGPITIYLGDVSISAKYRSIASSLIVTKYAIIWVLNIFHLLSPPLKGSYSVSRILPLQTMLQNIQMKCLIMCKNVQDILNFKKADERMSGFQFHM